MGEGEFVVTTAYVIWQVDLLTVCKHASRFVEIGCDKACCSMALAISKEKNCATYMGKSRSYPQFESI